MVMKCSKLFHAFVNLDRVGNANLTTNVPCGDLGDLNGQLCLSDYEDVPIITITSISSTITFATWHKYNKIGVDT
jgi:hypothetical protein